MLRPQQEPIPGTGVLTSHLHDNARGQHNALYEADLLPSTEHLPRKRYSQVIMQGSMGVQDYQPADHTHMALCSA